MTPRALTLAALANAAMPGMAPVSVTPVSTAHPWGPQRFHTAIVTDADGGQWVVQLPTDAVFAARQDAVIPLLSLLGSRVPFAVPTPQGEVRLRDGRSAVVYPRLPGAPLDLARLPAGSQVAARVGQAIAAIHNLDRALIEEATLPTYEGEDCRRRHLADLDRLAGTGRAPAGLLSRWEAALDDVSRWRFAPTVIHGRLTGSRILLQADDPADSDTAQVAAILGWEEACVGDPAADFAHVVRWCTPAAADTVFEAYAMARTEPAESRLLERATLLAEFDVGAAFLGALLAEDDEGATRLADQLAELDKAPEKAAETAADGESQAGPSRDS